MSIITITGMITLAIATGITIITGRLITTGLMVFTMLSGSYPLIITGIPGDPGAGITSQFGAAITQDVGGDMLMLTMIRQRVIDQPRLKEEKGSMNDWFLRNTLFEIKLTRFLKRRECAVIKENTSQTPESIRLMFRKRTSDILQK